ncbi:MAG: helix-turn-helix domain-containing protein, partial [Streptosporangiales bacterium]
TSAERTALYKTLTNPVRRRILHYIGYYGMANSTAVARALGESTGTTSYHLRKLADLHLIEEVPERSAGRERWWRLLPFEHTAASPADQTAAERDALQEWSSQRLAADIELYIKGLAEYDGPHGWVQGQRHGCYLTREELLSFFRDYLALLGRYGHPKEDAPAGARPMALRFLAVPEPEDPAPGPPPGNAEPAVAG